jgi:hypothetical protein
MNKTLAFSTIVSLTMSAPLALAAQDNVGCGWGSMVFAGKTSTTEQVLAATTNGTSGNQTFGITSGTAGCSKDGIVPSYAKLEMFTGSNIDRLAADMSAGQGEALTTMANLWGIDESDKPAFYQAAHSNFDKIFTSVNVTSEQVLENMKRVLAANTKLAKYAS